MYARRTPTVVQQVNNPTSRLYFLNGPNANLYGLDSSGTYGTESFPQIAQRCRSQAEELNVALDFRQTNHEGVLIDWIQEAGASKSGGIVLNAGGYTHTSIAIRDAVAAVAVPVVEVHISNIYARDEFRHHSHIAPVAKATLAGFGVAGYELAIAGLAALLGQNQLASRAAGKRKS